MTVFLCLAILARPCHGLRKPALEKGCKEAPVLIFAGAGRQGAALRAYL